MLLELGCSGFLVGDGSEVVGVVRVQARSFMAASLRGGRTVPEVREELMISVMSWPRGVRQDLTRAEGMGSSGQVDYFMQESISERSGVVMGEERER